MEADKKKVKLIMDLVNAAHEYSDAYRCSCGITDCGPDGLDEALKKAESELHAAAFYLFNSDELPPDLF